MKPYRSVSGGWSLVNLVAVESFGVPLRELVKKLPRFCLERSTVGGRLSSGTMEANSTLGGGNGPFTSVGVTAVVGARELCFVSSAGRLGAFASSMPIAALEREMKFRPAATAPATTSLESGSFRTGGTWLDTLAARDRARCRPRGSLTLIPSSRALLTSVCAHSASLGWASPYKIEPVSGVRIRWG